MAGDNTARVSDASALQNAIQRACPQLGPAPSRSRSMAERSIGAASPSLRRRRSAEDGAAMVMTETKGAVEEQGGGLQPVELAVQVVASDETQEPIAEQVLLEPGLIKLPALGRLEIAHSLSVADHTDRESTQGS